MKKNIQRKDKEGDVIFEEIEQSQEHDKLPNINRKHVKHGEPVAVQGGYPTLFKIRNNNVQYYNGERKADAMEKWYTNHQEGGEEITPLVSNQEGGRRKKQNRTIREKWGLYGRLVSGIRLRRQSRSNLTRRKTSKKKGCGCFDLGKWR
jgi:hypothetical protein